MPCCHSTENHCERTKRTGRYNGKIFLFSIKIIHMKNTVPGIFLLLFALAAQAQDVISVRPLTHKILMVHLSEGYIEYHRAGQTASDDVVVRNELDVLAASQTASYQLSSSDDSHYQSALHPTEVGRKTKGTAFSGICQGWGFLPYFNEVGCLNTDPDHVKEHWLYLFLPQPLVSGATYTLELNGLVSNGHAHTFTFRETTLRSDAVHVNQIGYSTKAPRKFGYVYSWLGDKGGLDLSPYAGNAFHLVDTLTRQIVFTGSLAFRKPADSPETGQVGDTPNQNFLGGEVYECDFSAFNTPGEYRLVVEGIGCSYPFRIHADVLREPFHYAMRGIYQNRSGIPLTMPYAQARPAPHNVLTTPGFAGRLKYTRTTWCQVSSGDASMDDKPLWEAGIAGNLTQTWGWYQDAGDWDGYLSHMKIPSYLLFLYEQFPGNFTDGEIILPESGNGQPDVLDEARWLLRFYKRLKDELVEKNWGTGGIGGSRIFGDLWGSDSGPNGTGRGSWMDTDRTWVVSGEDPFVTYWYAGAAAHYHYLLARSGWIDTEGINWLNEAEAAYTWAKAHEGASGTCHEFSLVHLRAYAAASLYKATGRASYHSNFLQDAPRLNLTASNQSLLEEKAFAAWQYFSLPAARTVNPGVFNECKAAIMATADFHLLLEALDGRACRWGGNFWFPMLVGQATTPKVVEGAMAMALLKQAEPEKAFAYQSALFQTADYFLGNNPLNMTWITGLGENYPQHIFHLDSWYAPNGGMRKGVNVYGPWRSELHENYGPWRAEWPALTTYPDFHEFPGHERWFGIRTAPLTAEFTIHQNNLVSAFVFGALADSISPFTHEDPVGLSQWPAQANTLVVYPNPARDTFQFSLGEGIVPVSCVVLNKMGQVVKSTTTIEHTIDLKGMPAGLYFVIITDHRGKQWQGRMLKQ